MFGDWVEDEELDQYLADLAGTEMAQALADIDSFELDDDFVARLKEEAEAGLQDVLDSLAEDAR